MYKSIVLFFCLSVLIFISCEHPDYPEGYVDNGNLVVSVSDIPSVSRLNFVVYDSIGNRVKQINQLSTDKGFGAAEFQLPAGHYQLVVLGHSSDGNPVLTNPSKIQFKNNQGFTDTYLYYDRIDFGASRTQLPVNLTCISTLCRFVIVDPIPQNVAKIQFQYKGGSGAFNAHTGLGCVNSIQTETFPVKAGQDSTYFDLYTFLQADEGTISLQTKAFDANDNLITNRDFNIPLERNMMTLVSGNYFDSSYSGDNTDTPDAPDTSSGLTITVTVNTTWKQDITINY